LINPTDFLAQAHRLTDAQNNPTEVDLRSGISRAYYSVFNEATNLFRTRRNLTRPRVDAHKWVKNEIMNIDLKAGWDYGDYKNKREQADYDIHSNFQYLNQKDSETIVKNIDKLITNLQGKI
jgi:uncharacterized protein (UPF0332 family)